MARSYSSSSPRADHLLRLRDGRHLGYAEYGDPRGMPIVYCHGGLSSRLDIAFAAPACRAAGVRILAIDRPGIGLSDPQAGRPLLDWPDDVAAVVDALGLSRFAVLGWSAGGPYALACAVRLVERISRVGLVASIAPLDAPGMVRDLGLLADRLLYPLSRRAPAAAEWLLRLSRRLPPALIRGTLLHALESASDRHVVGALSAAEATDFFFEALRRSARGVVEDYRITGGPWGFPLEAVASEVLIWQGIEDTLVPPRYAQQLARQLPRAHLNLLPRRGHFLLRIDLDEVLAAMTGGAVAVGPFPPR